MPSWNIVVKVRLRMQFVAANAALVRKTTVVVLASAACSACSPALAPQNAAPVVLDVIQVQPVQRLAKTVWQDVSHMQASLRAWAAKLADFRPAGLRLVTLVLVVRPPRLALILAVPVALGALLLQGVLVAQSAKRGVIPEEDLHPVAPARLAESQLALLQLRVSNVTVECGPRWAMTDVWSAQPARERNLGTTSALSVNQDESRQVVLPFAKIAPSLLIQPGTLRAVSIARQEVFLKQARHRANSVQRVSDRTFNLQRVSNARRGGWQ